MSTDGRCIHEMLPGQCSICRGLPDDALYAAAVLGEPGHRVAKPAPWTRPGVVEAVRSTRCRSCHARIEPGDPIMFSEDVNAWVCVECGQ